MNSSVRFLCVRTLVGVTGMGFRSLHLTQFSQRMLAGTLYVSSRFQVVAGQLSKDFG